MGTEVHSAPLLPFFHKWVSITGQYRTPLSEVDILISRDCKCLILSRIHCSPMQNCFLQSFLEKIPTDIKKIEGGSTDQVLQQNSLRNILPSSLYQMATEIAQITIKIKHHHLHVWSLWILFCNCQNRVRYTHRRYGNPTFAQTCTLD